MSRVSPTITPGQYRIAFIVAYAITIARFKKIKSCKDMDKDSAKASKHSRI